MDHYLDFLRTDLYWELTKSWWFNSWRAHQGKWSDPTGTTEPHREIAGKWIARCFYNNHEDSGSTAEAGSVKGSLPWARYRAGVLTKVFSLTSHNISERPTSNYCPRLQVSKRSLQHQERKPYFKASSWRAELCWRVGVDIHILLSVHPGLLWSPEYCQPAFTF